MEGAHTRSTSGRAASRTTVEVAMTYEEMRKKMGELPDSTLAHATKELSSEQEKLLLEFWPQKRHDDVAKMLGISATTALKNYRRLTGRST